MYGYNTNIFTGVEIIWQRKIDSLAEKLQNQNKGSMGIYQEVKSGANLSNLRAPIEDLLLMRSLRNGIRDTSIDTRMKVLVSSLL